MFRTRPFCQRRVPLRVGNIHPEAQLSVGDKVTGLVKPQRAFSGT
ncbi:MAG: hypothetical protein Ct9H300mP16_12220 [Pseudomonadota bacterium]|nr:MAG: hypothetical protein Ct9H300mP16_12220 [Pseudomonadota bacterium]